MIAGIAVVLALVVPPARDAAVREVASPSGSVPANTADVAVVAVAAESGAAVAAHNVAPSVPAPPAPVQVAPVRDNVERPATAHSPPARHSGRAAARSYRDRFNSYGRNFAFFPYRNRWH